MAACAVLTGGIYLNNLRNKSKVIALIQFFSLTFLHAIAASHNQLRGKFILKPWLWECGSGAA